MEIAMSTSVKLTMLVAALGLCGCPGAGGESGAGDQPAADNTAPAEAGGSPGIDGNQAPDSAPDGIESASTAAADGEATAEPEQKPNVDDEQDGSDNEPEGRAEIEPGANILGLDGLKLGTSPSAYRVYCDSRMDLVLTPTWIDEEQTGVIAASPVDDSRYFSELAHFLDGELVGVMRDREESVAEFSDFTNELERRFGPPGDEPPRWALVTPFFFGFQSPEEGVIMKFWGNSNAREVLFAARNNLVGASSYVLCDVDRFDSVAQAMQALPPPQQ